MGWGDMKEVKDNWEVLGKRQSASMERADQSKADLGSLLSSLAATFGQGTSPLQVAMPSSKKADNDTNITR